MVAIITTLPYNGGYYKDATMVANYKDATMVAIVKMLQLWLL